MSGGHWNYLSYKIEERVGVPLDDVWKLLAAIEHELDYGICGDTCYECAKIQVVNALEAYFDTEATSVDNSLRLLRSSESECARCKERDEQRGKPHQTLPRQAASIQVMHDGKLYRGTVYEIEPGKEHEQ
jgi:hypothetical protein